MNRRSIRRMTACYILVLSAILAFGQSNHGNISGTVTDRSGALVANAQLLARETATGAEYRAVSTGSGSYAFTELLPGTYNLTTTVRGFKVTQSTGVVVQVNNTSALNIVLDAGAVDQTVTVSANAPTIESETSDIGTTISEKQAIDLPLSLGAGSLRSPQSFVFLAPGTTGPGTAGQGANGTFQAKISGGQNFGDEVLVDGVSLHRDAAGETADGSLGSVEALTTFRVLTSSMSAEYGRTTGGITSFSTKSGTNGYHGRIYELFQNEALNANTWFNNNRLAGCSGDAACRLANRRPSDKENDYGITLGGPLSVPRLYDAKDRTFFFFSFEQYRKNLAQTNLSSVPNQDFRGGNFSITLGAPLLDAKQNPVINPCTGQPVLAGQIFDPSTAKIVNGVPCRSPFPGNKIDPKRFSKVAINVLGYLPPPNSGTGATQNFVFKDLAPILDTTMSVRIDHTLSQRSRLYFSYTIRENDLESGFRNLPDPVNSSSFNQYTPTHAFRGGWDLTLSPNMLNHLNLGVNRIQAVDKSYAGLDGTNYDAKLGISGLSGAGFPIFNYGEGLTQVSAQNFNAQVDSGGTAFDSIDWQKGRHGLKFGVDYRYQTFANIDTGHEVGAFNYGRAQTAATNDPNVASNTGNGFASFLLGQVANANAIVPALRPLWVSQYGAVFAQDDFKVSKTLTLNLGIRYDIDQPRYSRQGRTTDFSPTALNPKAGNLPGALVFAGQGTGRNGNTKETWADVWYKDFAPRLGFAWSPDFLGSKTVVRGAYGIFYGPLVVADFGASLQDGFTANASPTSLDGFSAAFNIDSGFPGPVPTAANFDPSQDNGFGGVTYIAKTDGRPAMVQNYSLQVQQELAPDLIFSLGYVGQHSTHLRSDLRYTNNLPIKYFALGSTLNADINSPAAAAAGVKKPYPTFSGTVAQALRPFPQYGFINSSCCLEDLGMSSYNSLQAQLQRRFRNGVNLLASYTWQKTLTDADSILPFFAQTSNGGATQNPYNLNAEKSLSSQDVPHTLAVSYLYELPIGKGKKFIGNSAVGDRILGGFEIGGVQRYQSGQPEAAPCGAGIPGTDTCTRFNVVPGQDILSSAARNGRFNPNIDSYLNRAAFVDANAQRGTGAFVLGSSPTYFGNARSPRYFNEDFSLIKRTTLFESLNVELRGEMFNAFNRHVFNRPITNNPFDPNFGVVNSTLNSPRIVQFTFKLNY